jgi:hypothetical protein
MVRNESRELWGHTSSSVACCEIVDGSKAATALHGPLGITYHPNEKANMIADCLENPFTSHAWVTKTMSDKSRCRVHALLASVDYIPFVKVRPYDGRKLTNSLKLRKTCGPDKCLRHLQRRPLAHLTHFFNHSCRLFYFPKPWKEAKVKRYWNLVRTRNILKIYIRLASCIQQASYSRKWFWK